MTFVTNCISIFYETAVTVFKYFTIRKQTDLKQIILLLSMLINGVKLFIV